MVSHAAFETDFFNCEWTESAFDLVQLLLFHTRCDFFFYRKKKERKENPQHSKSLGYYHATSLLKPINTFHLAISDGVSEASSSPLKSVLKSLSYGHMALPVVRQVATDFLDLLLHPLASL